VSRSVETTTVDRNPSVDDGADGDEHDRQEPPTGRVLGPLPLWASGLVLAALAGEQAALRSDDPSRLSATAGVAALAAIGLLVACGRRQARAHDHRSAWVTPGAAAAGAVGLLAVAAVALTAVGARAVTSDRGLLPALAAAGGTRPVSAVVVHEPRPTARGWHVLVRVVEVDGVTTRERAAVTVDDDPPALGQRWRGDASARPLPEGGYGRWLARQHATVVLDSARWVAVGRPGALARASEHVRERVRAAATARQSERLGGLLTGFVTGDTRLLPEDDAEAMRASGLTHLTAVSGTHVAILVGGVVAACAAVRVGARGQRRVLVVVLVAFAFLTRFQPSVLRAGTMGLVVLLAGARGMPRDARHGLAGAVLLLLLVDPLLAGSLGLLLSASAAAGVLLVAPVVRERLHRLPRRLAEVLAVTVGAQLAVVPLLLTTFGEVPLASVPANVLAVPPAALAIAGAMVAAMVSVPAPDLASWLFLAAGVPARAVLWSAHAFADVGWTATTGRPATVVALSAGAGWLVCSRERGTVRAALAVVTAAALVVAGAPLVTGRLPVRTLTVTAIDVGQGDAFLVESPDARVLVDAGEDGTAARWLRSNGRRHLDLLVVTHGHLDHVGGAADVVRSIAVGTVWYRPIPTDLPEAAELVTVAATRQVPVRAPATGDVAIVGDLHLEVLSPDRGRPYRWAPSELNDSSLVVLATWGEVRVLLTGDVEAAAQGDLLGLPARTGRPDLLEVDLLTVPHHGSATTDPAFLRAVRPRVAVISAGVDNRHGHPHPAILALLDELGVEVRRTDLEGTLRIAVPARRPAAPAGRRRPVGSAHAARAPPRR
jgi:competence protein ComEC